MIARVAVTRYVTPLREGGSLPGLVEAEDLGLYVCKFRGAGQGVRVLVAEVLVAQLAQRLGLRTPTQVALQVSPELARYEADEEVQDLLRASVGLNLGVDFLPGSFGWEAGVDPVEEAARILWLDALTANVDRSWRNPNLLRWHGNLWLIDHGAALYFHHGWREPREHDAVAESANRWAAQPYDAADHVFAAHAGLTREHHDRWCAALPDETLSAAVAAIPQEWLSEDATIAAELRSRYGQFLRARLRSTAWLPGAAS